MPRCLRGETTFFPVFLMLLLHALITQAEEPVLAIRPREAPDGWHLAFEDTFERADLGDDWVALDGEWKLEQGRLAGHGQILAAGRFPGDQRLEFDAGSPKPGDLSGIVTAGDDGFKSGVFVGFASSHNSKAKILVWGREVTAVPGSAEPDRAYRVVCQRKGDRVTLTVDGETLMEHDVEGVPADAGHGRAGVYLWLPGWVDNVKLYTGSADTAARARDPGFTEIRRDDLQSHAATGNWRPDPAQTGWRVQTEGEARAHITAGAGIDGAAAIEVVRPPDSINSLFWRPGQPGRVNSVRFRLSVPSDESGVNAIVRAGSKYLTDLRVSRKDGIELRAGGGAWGRNIRLVKPLAFKTDHWYAIEKHFDFERNMVRIRVDDGRWTDWTPLLKSREADRIDDLYLYAYTAPEGVSYRLGETAAGYRPVKDVNTLVYRTDGSATRNTLCVEMKLLDEQGEGEFMVTQGDTPVSAVLFNTSELTLYTARGDGARAPFLRGAAVAPGKRYRVEVQHDFEHARVRGRVNGLPWSRWFAFVDGNTADGFDTTSLTTYSPGGKPETLLLTRLYTTYLDVPPLPERNAAVSQAIYNGGFETLLPGIIGEYPDNWIVERTHRRDDVALITDPATSRGGRRHFSIRPAGDGGIRLHNLTYGGLEYEPGATYRFEFWARAEGDGPATITADPGNRTFEVISSEWTRFVYERLHAMTAEPKLGFRLDVKGGPVAIDDVSALPAEVETPPAATATDWSTLRTLPVKADWSGGDTERVVIGVANPGETDVSGAPTGFELRQLWQARSFAFITPDALRIVDASVPEKTVLWSLQEVDASSGPSPRDRLVLAADCPAGAVNQYHVYTAGRATPDEPTYLPTRLPEPLQGVAPGQIEARVMNREERAAPPQQAAPALTDPSLWGAPALARLMPDAVPRRGPVRIAAAKGERESFQVCIDAAADRPLSGVRLEVGLFTASPAGAALDPEAVRIWSQEHVTLLCGNASVNGTVGGYKWNANAFSRTGDHPDPLLPWRSQDVPAGGRKAAWITLGVPRDAPAGVYTGRVTARCEGARELTLPVELKVFDFEMPRRRRFTPALGADPRGTLPEGLERGEVAPYLAAMLAERGMVPWTYGMRSSAYNVPWTYDPESGEATFDFSIMDRNLPRLQELDLRYLFFNFRSYGNDRVARVFDSGGEEIQVETERGRAMWRAWIRGVGDYLNEHGWEDQSIVYLADEIALLVDAGCRELGRLVHESPPGMKTWVLSSATGPWWTHLEETDVFGGPISHGNLARFRKQGGEWWGLYNRPWLIGSPLWTTRAIGLHSYLIGATGYAHWSVTNWENRPWINAGMILRGEGANPARGGRHLMYGMFAPGMAVIIYPWPEFEGAPERGDHPPVVPSIRLEALAEGMDDYEYAALLEETIATLSGAEADQGRALMQRLKALVDEGDLGGDFQHHMPSHGVFVIDEKAFETVRADIGRFLGQHLYRSRRPLSLLRQNREAYE